MAPRLDTPVPATSLFPVSYFLASHSRPAPHHLAQVSLSSLSAHISLSVPHHDQPHCTCQPLPPKVSPRKASGTVLSSLHPRHLSLVPFPILPLDWAQLTEDKCFYLETGGTLCLGVYLRGQGGLSLSMEEPSELFSPYLKG